MFKAWKIQRLLSVETIYSESRPSMWKSIFWLNHYLPLELRGTPTLWVHHAELLRASNFLSDITYFTDRLLQYIVWYYTERHFFFLADRYAQPSSPTRKLFGEYNGMKFLGLLLLYSFEIKFLLLVVRIAAQLMIDWQNYSSSYRLLYRDTFWNVFYFKMRKLLNTICFFCLFIYNCINS